MSSEVEGLLVLMATDASKRQMNPRTSGHLVRLAMRYRYKTAVVVSLLVVAGLIEGVGMISLLPLLGAASGEASSNPVTGWVDSAFAYVGVETSPGLLLVVIVVAIAAKAAISIAALRYAGFLAARVATDLRMALIRALMKARWPYFVSQPIGRLANAMSSEAIRASQVFTHGSRLVSYMIQLVIFIGLAFAVSWRVASMALLVGGLMTVSLRVFVRMARRAGEEETRVQSGLLARLTDVLASVKNLKAMGKESDIQPQLEREIEAIDQAYKDRATSAAVLQSIHEPFMVFFLAILLYVLISQFGTPVDELVFVAFLLYRVLNRFGAVQQFYQRVVMDESALSSIEASVARAVQDEETFDGRKTPTLSQDITFENVSFSYDATPVLTSASFRIPSGSFTALSGPSGSGKTTIADLIIGLQTPNTGRVMIDSVDLSEIDLMAWRTRVGYVPQDVVLFHDTIYANVVLGTPGIATAEVEQALRKADLWDYVSSLPDGMHTIVGERGGRMSGGQRQRLALARALARQPLLLILDEATTGLDGDTEASIIATLRSLKGDVTILAISHQPALVEAAELKVTVDPTAGTTFSASKDTQRPLSI